MNFTVVDIEVVNDAVTSIATIGVVGVDKNKIVEEIEFQVKPAPFYFEEKMVAINGLKKEHFADAPDFSKIWGDLSTLLSQYDFCVAHNAAFDFGVLKGCCKEYSLAFKDFPVVDSLAYSKNSNLDIPNYRLDTLCNHLGIELINYHSALCDAVATAKVMLKIIDANNDNILDVFLKGNICSTTNYQARTKLSFGNNDGQKKHNDNWKLRAKDVEAADITFCKENLLSGKKFVISGELSSMERRKAYAILKACGAEPCDNLTMSTNYLVTNAQSMTGKLKKAAEYIEKGKDIKIINEDEFLKMLEEAHEK